MGMFCLNMLAIALELARENRAYEDIATKFFEHFLYIAGAHEQHRRRGHRAVGRGGRVLLRRAAPARTASMQPLKVRSLVGLIPLLAVETIEPELLERLPDFRRAHGVVPEASARPGRPGLALARAGRGRAAAAGAGARPPHEARCCKRMLDPDEFLSDYGVRVAQQYHLEHPYALRRRRRELRRSTTSRPSRRTGLFGGNSNWRGPIWFPINYLLIEALQKFHHYYGDDFLVECPTGSGQIADAVAGRRRALAPPDRASSCATPTGGAPVFGGSRAVPERPALARPPALLRVLPRRHRRGLGASHQTGWTASWPSCSTRPRRAGAAGDRRLVRRRPRATECRPGRLPRPTRLPVAQILEHPFVAFGREITGDLRSALRREWLVTNGLGGYASGTVAGGNTRRYHGLLVAALHPPVERTVLVAGSDRVGRL